MLGRKQKPHSSSDIQTVFKTKEKHSIKMKPKQAKAQTISWESRCLIKLERDFLPAALVRESFN